MPIFVIILAIVMDLSMVFFALVFGINGGLSFDFNKAIRERTETQLTT